MVLTLERRETFSEVLEVLRHMDKTYVDMLPKKLIMFLYDNCSLEYDFRMTKSIGEENLKEDTLELLALINYNYWTKNKSKEDLIIDFASIDKQTQRQLNSQLEQKNVFTKIDVAPENLANDSNSNLPVLTNNAIDFIKKILKTIKNWFINFFGD